MRRDASRRRRIVGAAALGGALVMLIAGQTSLRGQLDDLGYLLYWLVCFVLTLTAIVIAFVDVRALRQRVHDEQHRLLEDALKDISRESADRRTQHGSTKPR